jgi:hypothetical protein
MRRVQGAVSGAADRVLRRGLERLHRSSPVLVPEYPLRPRPRWGWREPAVVALEQRLAAGAADYEPDIRAVTEMLEWARTIPRHPSGAGGPHWENDWWGGLDALMQCAALRRRDPALYIEVGSGSSTLFARRAIDDFGLRTHIVSIDPEPRADVEGIVDDAIRCPLEDADLGVFGRLSDEDMLFVDGSHTALMNSDSTVFFLEVLPALPSGLLLGLDDVFLPWDYPPTWEHRVYGEQYLLAAFLLGGNAGWKVRFPAWWLAHDSERATRFEPLWPVVERTRSGRPAASFWLERDAG